MIIAHADRAFELQVAGFQFFDYLFQLVEAAFETCRLGFRVIGHQYILAWHSALSVGQTYFSSVQLGHPDNPKRQRGDGFVRTPSPR